MPKIVTTKFRKRRQPVWYETNLYLTRNALGVSQEKKKIIILLITSICYDFRALVIIIGLGLTPCDYYTRPRDSVNTTKKGKKNEKKNIIIVFRNNIVEKMTAGAKSFSGVVGSPVRDTDPLCGRTALS